VQLNFVLLSIYIYIYNEALLNSYIDVPARYSKVIAPDPVKYLKLVQADVWHGDVKRTQLNCHLASSHLGFNA